MTVTLVLIALLAPYISPYDPLKADPTAMFQPPSAKHLFGTNEVGEDILSGIIWGTRVSLMVGVLATTVAVLVGTLVGVTSGYMGGFVDEVLMRVVDFFLVVPNIVLAMVTASLLGPSLMNIIVVIGLLSWSGTARIVRSSVLVFKEMPFVEASRVAGGSTTHILRKHILPNVMPLVYATATLNIANAIFVQSALAFLGVGNIMDLSWGQMLHFAYKSGAIMAGYYWYALPPGAMIGLSVLAFSLSGYGLDEILNPKLGTSAVVVSA